MIWIFILSILSIVFTPLFSLVIGIESKHKAPLWLVVLLFILSGLYFLFFISCNYLNFIFSINIHHLYFDVFSFLFSIFILRILKIDFPKQTDMLNLYSNIKNIFCKRNLFRLIQAPGIISLLIIMGLSAGGFLLFPNDILKVGQSELSKYILLFGGILFLVLLALFFAMQSMIGIKELNIMPMFIIGIPVLLSICILLALVDLLSNLISAFDMTQMMDFFHRLNTGFNYAFNAEFREASGISYIDDILLVFVLLSILLFASYYQKIKIIKRFIWLVIFSLIIHASSIIIDQLILSRYFDSNILNPILNENKVEKDKIEIDLSKIEKSIFSFDIPFIHLKYMLGASYLCNGDNINAKKIFNSIVNEPLIRPHYLQVLSNQYLNIKDDSEVLSYKFIKLNDADYLTEEWNPILTLMKYIQESCGIHENEFKEILRKISTKYQEIKLPSVKSLIDLSVFSNHLGFDMKIEKYNSQLVQKLFENQIPFLIKMTRSLYNNRYLANDANYFFGSEYILPVCMNREKEWIGIYDDTFKFNYHKDKELDRIKNLINFKENEIHHQIISNQFRENMIILPFDELDQYLNSSEARIVILDYEKLFGSKLRKEFDSYFRNTKEFLLLSQAKYYFDKYQYIHAFNILKELDLNVNSEEIEQYLGLCSLILKQKQIQNSDLNLLKITKDYLDSFCDQNANQIEKSMTQWNQLIQQYDINPVVFYYYWNRFIKKKWDLNIIDFITWLKKYAKIINNYYLNKDIIPWLIKIEDYEGLKEFIPKILKISPHLGSYQLLYVYSLWFLHDDKYGEEFNQLPYVLFSDNFNEEGYINYINSLLKDDGTDDLLDVRWKYSSARWNFLQGEQLSKKNQYVVANKYYQKAYHLDSSNVNYLASWIQCLKQLEQVDQNFIQILENKLALLS